MSNANQQEFKFSWFRCQVQTKYNCASSNPICFYFSLLFFVTYLNTLVLRRCTTMPACPIQSQRHLRYNIRWDLLCNNALHIHVTRRYSYNQWELLNTKLDFEVIGFIIIDALEIRLLSKSTSNGRSRNCQFVNVDTLSGIGRNQSNILDLGHEIH